MNLISSVFSETCNDLIYLDVVTMWMRRFLGLLADAQYTSQ